jgi:hypothetical protein
MDSIEPEQTPFAAVSAQTSRIQRVSSGLFCIEGHGFLGRG